jgi:hypothetical protein
LLTPLRPDFPARPEGYRWLVSFWETVRDSWPALLATEVIVASVTVAFALLGAAPAVLAAAGLLFGVVAPAAGVFLSWAAGR